MQIYCSNGYPSNMFLTVILIIIYTSIDVTQAGMEPGQCHLDDTSATVTTFDSLSYEASAGYYRMTDNRMENIFVDVLMSVSGTEAVPCGVAVSSTSARARPRNIIDITPLETDLVVTFTDLGNSADIDVIVSPTYWNDCSGLCGNYNGDPSDDMLGMTLPQFLERNRFPFSESFFSCPEQPPSTTTTVPPSTTVPPVSCPGCCHAADTRQIDTFDQHSYAVTSSAIYTLSALMFENVFVEVNMTSETTCALGLRSGTHFTSEGDRGEKVIFSTCDGTMKVLRCQDEQTQPIILDSNGLYQTSDYDGHVTVTVKESGSGLAIYVMRSEDTYPPSGLCGNADSDATNEYNDLSEFLENYSVDFASSVFNCVIYTDADVMFSV